MEQGVPGESARGTSARGCSVAAIPSSTDRAGADLATVESFQAWSALFNVLRHLVSALFFLSLDIADFALCYVFAGLDRLFGDSWGPCYCSRACTHGNEESKRAPGSFKNPPEITPLLPSATGPLEHETSRRAPGSPQAILGSGVIGAGHGRQAGKRNDIFEGLAEEGDTPEPGGPVATNSCFERWTDLLYAESCIAFMRKQQLRLKSLSVNLPFSTSFAALQQLLPSINSETACNTRKAAHSVDRGHDQAPALRRAVSELSSSQWRTGIRWTDCSCADCAQAEREVGRKLFVQVIEERSFLEPGEAAPGTAVQAKQTSQSAENSSAAASDVVFLHGFCSSSSFWADTAVPHFSENFRNTHRLLLVDLLGFGRSPKPRDCRYTVGEHAERIESDVLRAKGVRRFHLVAHSMGCTVALAVAARNLKSVISITLFSPPFAVPPQGINSPALAFFVSSAPRLIGPGMDVGISVMAWYEHVGRLMCCILTKGHRLWEPVADRLSLTRRIPRSFVRDFMRHTHHSAWHCYYNTICEGASLYPVLLQHLQEESQRVAIIHGQADTLCPIKASRQLAADYANVDLEEVPSEDHVTVVLGRDESAARTVERIIFASEEKWRIDELNRI